MAKREKHEEPQQSESQPITTAAVEKIEEFAEDLGQLLGHARGKAQNWLSQRQSIVKNLVDLRDTATKLLNDLGHQAQEQVAKVTGTRRGRPRLKKKAPPTPVETRKRVMSPEARKRISEAQKARWASLNAKAKK